MHRNKVMLVLIPASILTILVLVTPIEKASLADAEANDHDAQIASKDPTTNILADTSTKTDSQQMQSLDNLVFVNFDTDQELKTISRTFSATAGSSSESRIITLTSTQFPVVIHAIYIEASLGTGKTAISAEEKIVFDKYRVNRMAAIDPSNVSLMNDSNTEVFVRILLSQDSDGEIEDTFPLVIDNDFELEVVLDSLGENGARDPDNGFNFTVIAVVMAPANADVTLS